MNSFPQATPTSLTPLASRDSLASSALPNVSWGAVLSNGIWRSWAPHDTGSTRAEPALAAGSDRLMTATTPGLGAFFNPQHGDDQIGNYSRNPYDPLTLNNWLGPALPGDSKSYWINQPQLLVDPVGPDGLGNLQECYVHIAYASRSSDHSALLVRANTYWTGTVEFGEWNMASWDVSQNGTLYAAYVRAGETINAILITANMYAWADNSFQYSQLWSIPKAEMYPPFGGAGHTEWSFTHDDGSPAASLVPAVSYVNSTITYLVSAWNPPGEGTANKLSVWTIDTQNPLAPIINKQTVPVADFSVPPDAQQKGTDVLITTWDASITNAVLQPNGLWVAQGTGGTFDGDTAVRSCVRWYQLDPGGSEVLQQETLGFPGWHFYHPSIAANANGDMTLAFNVSADSSYVGLYYTGRRASDPANTAANLVLVHRGEGCFVRPEVSGVNPLGSRTAAALDLSDGRSMWIFGAYPAGTNADCKTNRWGTWLARVTW
jgi:hypothetical protein